jgi:predicted dehydrogenase
VNLGPYRRDASVVWDLAPHDFAILLHWLGSMPLTVRAVGRDAIAKGNADMAFVWLEFPARLMANVELSWLAPSKLRRTTIVGSRKMIVYEDGNPEPVKIYDHGIVYHDAETFGEHHLSYRTGDILVPRIEPREPLAEELRDFVDSARDGVVGHRYTGLARDVVQLTESAETSVGRGGASIDIVRTGDHSLLATR